MKLYQIYSKENGYNSESCYISKERAEWSAADMNRDNAGTERATDFKVRELICEDYIG